MKSDSKRKIYKFLYCERGSISSRIVLVFLTLLIIGTSVVFLLENQKKNRREYHRKAMQLSDYGFQQVMEQGKEAVSKNPENIKGIEKTQYNEGWYKATVKTSKMDSTFLLNIVSEGHCGTESVIQNKKIFLSRKIIDEDTIWVVQQPKNNFQ